MTFLPRILQLFQVRPISESQSQTIAGVTVSHSHTEFMLHLDVIQLSHMTHPETLQQGHRIIVYGIIEIISVIVIRALCRTKLLPVTHVLVDTWMLRVKLVYELSDVPDDLKWATNTHVTPFTLTFKA